MRDERRETRETLAGFCVQAFQAVASQAQKEVRDGIIPSLIRDGTNPSQFRDGIILSLIRDGKFRLYIETDWFPSLI